MTVSEKSSRGFADVHAHLYDKRFGATLEETAQYLERAKTHGVARCVCACASPGDWNRAAEIAKKLPDVFPAFGVHPWNCRRVSGDWLAPLANFLDSFVAYDGATKAALGEVGLDFAVRDCDDELRKAQEKTFRDQLELADARKIPVTVHSVRANEKVLSIIREYPNVPAWLLHGWRATPPEIENAVEIGAFFSFSARFVAKDAHALRDVVTRVPRDRLLVDAPAPGRIRTGRGNPAASVDLDSGARRRRVYPRRARVDSRDSERDRRRSTHAARRLLPPADDQRAPIFRELADRRLKMTFLPADDALSSALVFPIP